MSHTCIYFSAENYFGYFQAWAVVNNNAVDILFQVFNEYYLQVTLGRYFHLFFFMFAY